MQKVPKKQGFASTIPDNGVENAKTKTEVIREAGFTPKQVEWYQTPLSRTKQKQKPLLFRQKNLQRLHTKTQ